VGSRDRLGQFTSRRDRGGGNRCSRVTVRCPAIRHQPPLLSFASPARCLWLARRPSRSPFLIIASWTASRGRRPFCDRSRVKPSQDPRAPKMAFDSPTRVWRDNRRDSITKATLVILIPNLERKVASLPTSSAMRANARASRAKFEARYLRTAWSCRLSAQIKRATRAYSWSFNAVSTGDLTSSRRRLTVNFIGGQS